MAAAGTHVSWSPSAPVSTRRAMTSTCPWGRTGTRGGISRLAMTGSSTRAVSNTDSIPVQRPPGRAAGAPPGPGRAAGSPPGQDGPVAPLVATLALDPTAQARFDALRTRWFPAARNHLGGHVTLFHALPGEQLAQITRTVAGTTGSTPPFDVEVTGVRLLGRGVALDLAAAELARVHAALAEAFAPWMTRQDRQRFSPHVTVQNKVPPAEAAALAAQLTAGFTRETVRATGVELWWYRGGPWEHVATEPFTG